MDVHEHSTNCQMVEIGIHYKAFNWDNIAHNTSPTNCPNIACLHQTATPSNLAILDKAISLKEKIPLPNNLQTCRNKNSTNTNIMAVVSRQHKKSHINNQAAPPLPTGRNEIQRIRRHSTQHPLSIKLQSCITNLQVDSQDCLPNHL